MENEKQLSDSVGISDELAISSRHYLALEHLWAALNNARLCRELERQLMNKVAFDSEHRAYAMGAVISSVAFLEALVNETYEDAGDEEHVSERVSALSETVRQRLGTFGRRRMAVATSAYLMRRTWHSY